MKDRTEAQALNALGRKRVLLDPIRGNIFWGDVSELGLKSWGHIDFLRTKGWFAIKDDDRFKNSSSHSNTKRGKGKKSKEEKHQLKNKKKR